MDQRLAKITIVLGTFLVLPVCAEAATIIVAKQTNPDGAFDSFTFTGDAAGVIGDDQQIVVTGLAAGTYTSTELVPPAWDLTSIICDDADSTGSVQTATATFRVAAGETVTCTFLDTQQQPGTIIVAKQTNPDGAFDSFTFTGDAAGVIGDDQQIVVTGLAAGTYTSTELVPPAWDLTSIICDDADSTGSVQTATATFRVAAGETVTCTFLDTAQDLLFADGFESGDTTAWSSSVP